MIKLISATPPISALFAWFRLCKRESSHTDTHAQGQRVTASTAANGRKAAQNSRYGGQTVQDGNVSDSLAPRSQRRRKVAAQNSH